MTRVRSHYVFIHQSSSQGPSSEVPKNPGFVIRKPIPRFLTNELECTMANFFCAIIVELFSGMTTTQKIGSNICARHSMDHKFSWRKLSTKYQFLLLDSSVWVPLLDREERQRSSKTLPFRGFRQSFVKGMSSSTLATEVVSNRAVFYACFTISCYPTVRRISIKRPRRLFVVMYDKHHSSESNYIWWNLNFLMQEEPVSYQ